MPMLACFILLALSADAPVEGSRPNVSTLKGQVVELTKALNEQGRTFDEAPIATQVVLKDQDNTLTPLLSDDASRALFQDERLRDRPAELRVRRLPKLPYVQVLSFKVEFNGTLRTPEYYCEICSISVRYPQTCPCCQGPMDLRMQPKDD
ncbi:hypothetical protein [Singulisphaera acidiphila]|uniref:Uncharacterized protein n=1 Tax=Singulisphaera acidiphila (strain ATCC BAA-1392 / DSM 18658 / VKM B-2454 / MOB10) TaxID=886293 RepID=L0DKM1_SINAD|nr:hypothetical protein [Singulisphaera acidiphila]AGA29388.1 hypothetical protein Sinac_5236 [Singulisphaera acidiphila DSM 18658]